MRDAATRRSSLFPAATVLVALSSLLLFSLPQGARLFVYDRQLVLAGEIGRLLTGHLVHFSASHLLYNLAVFMVTGCWIERHGRGRFVLLMALTVAACGLYFLVAAPRMTAYGGLSGLVSACVVYLALQEMSHSRRDRALWAAILLLYTAKVAWEFMTGTAIFAAAEATPFRVVPAVHLIGGLCAATLFYATRAQPSRAHP